MPRYSAFNAHRLQQLHNLNALGVPQKRLAELFNCTQPRVSQLLREPVTLDPRVAFLEQQRQTLLGEIEAAVLSVAEQAKADGQRARDEFELLMNTYATPAPLDSYPDGGAEEAGQ